MSLSTAASNTRSLPKARTGIEGLDEVLSGGLPEGRCTLVCGGPGTGKTLLAMEFLVRGTRDFGEPGVFIAFEEPVADLIENVASLGFDLEALAESGQILVDHVDIQPFEMVETGAFDLDGLFIRLGHAIDKIGAKRVVLDTIETLFSGFIDHRTLRAELRRLFHWLKDRGVTAIVTGERGEGTLTRDGLEEYVSDCVIDLEQRVLSDVATRRLRVVKYRGTAHGTNAYPFLISEDGFSVVPITSVKLDQDASEEKVPTGVASLDEMFTGGGFFRGSSILVSGSAGTGKSSLISSFVAAACARGERCLYFAMEESQSQVLRNMRSIGLDLTSPVQEGLLEVHAYRPTSHGLEMHLAHVVHEINSFDPQIVVIDPISNLDAVGTDYEVRMMLLHLVDQLKSRGITGMVSALTVGDEETSGVGVSSLMDTWLALTNLERNGERTRLLSVKKSRGMAHSNRVREFVMTDSGIELVDVFTEGDSVLIGTARENAASRRKD